MKITYLAWMRDKIGCAQEEIPLPAGVNDVGRLIEWLAGRGPKYEEAFEFVEVIKVVVNRSLAQNDHPLADDDEVTFIPPIGGG